MTELLILAGRLRRKADKTGIHGVRVGAWILKRGIECTIAETRSEGDGRYTLTVDEKYTGTPVGVRVHDRNENQIYETKRRRRFEVGKETLIDIALDRDALRYHDAKPTDFDRAAPGFDNRSSLEDDIEAAIEMISPRGTTTFANMSRAGLCPGPPFELFEDLRRHSFGVIDGDPRSMRLFEEGLSVLRSSGVHPHPPEAERFESARAIEAGDQARALDGQPIGEPSIGPDQAVPIMAATALVGQPGDMDFVLGGLCGFEDFGWLHRRAIDAVGAVGGASRMRGILGGRGGEWGPDDGPPVDFGRPCPPEQFHHDRCAGAVTGVIGIPPNYRVDDVTPDMACANQLITITGGGFTNVPGKVRFSRRSNSDPIEVDAETWTDTEITVRVPADATCGVRLRIPWQTVEVCERFITFYRRPIIVDDFDGSGVDIQTFTDNGRSSVRCYEPGDELTLRWETCGATSVDVRLLGEDNQTLASDIGTAADGSMTFTVPPGNRTQRLTARIRAEGSCAPTVDTLDRELWIHKVPDLSVDGMEVTQSIQYYRAAQHLTDPIDRGPDNSIQLIAGKTTWVRVYLRSGQDPAWDDGQLSGVTGTLRVERRNGTAWDLVGSLNPVPPGASVVAEANPGYPQERGVISDTLNFMIPANMVTGRLRLTTNAFSDSAPCGGGTAQSNVVVDADLAQTLNVAGIAVGYNGPAAVDNNINLPTLAQLQTTAGLTIAMFPVADTATFRMAGNFTQTVPLTDALGANGSGCTPNWDAFMANVRAVVNADGNQATDVYYGIMATGIPMGPVIGCGGGGLGTGAVGNGGTMAHEIGHALGLAHAPCGNPPGPDPNYPAYEPYDPPNTAQASIGEYAIDNRNGDIFQPATPDLMSYCGPSWISLYHYQRLLNVARLTPTGVPTARVATGPVKVMTEATPLIDLLISLDEVGGIRSVVVSRIKMRPYDQGDRTDMTAELVDKEGKVIASAPVVGFDIAPCGCGNIGAAHEPRRLQAAIADVAKGAALQVRRGDEIIWKREAPAKSPKMEIRRAKLQKNGLLDVGWTCEVDSQATVDVWVRWSPADKDDWRAVSVGLTGSSAKLDVSHIPGGDVKFEVMVQDGFSCATTTSNRIRLPKRPPVVAILAPETETPISAGQPILARGSVTTVDGTSIDDSKAVWALDGEKVGEGLIVWIDPVKRGNHTLTLESSGTRTEHVFVAVDPSD